MNSEDKSNGTILVVDDLPATISLVRNALEERGYDVLVATNSNEALQRAALTTPDLILLDLLMPGLDGYDICKQLKLQTATQHIPVIFITEVNAPVDKAKGFQLGAVDYITKPIDIEELAARVKTHLTITQLQRDITGCKRAEVETQALVKFLNENPNPVMQIAKDGLLLYANRASEDLIQCWNCAVGEQLPEFWRRLILETLASGLPKEEETVCGTRVFALMLTPFVESCYVNLYGRDITERKRVEEALYFVAQKGWQAGTESFLNALARFLGETLKVDYVVIDKISEDPAVAETVALYAKGALVPNMRYALKGTPCENVMGRRLCVYQQGVQQLFPEDTLLAEMDVDCYVGIPLWDSTGRPIGLIAVMNNKPLSDIVSATHLLQLIATRAAAELEREQSDRLLRMREHEFRTLAENSPDVIVRYDREGRYIYVNPEFERVNHLSAQDVQGKTPLELSTELAPKADVFTERLMAVMASGTADKIDLSWTEDEKLICWFVRLVPEFDADGKVASTLTIWSDISERKQAEEEILRLNQKLEQRVADRTAQLEMANKELEAFAYSVSHDLRAPLRHIDGFLQLLKKSIGAELDEQSHHYITTITDSARHMGSLIDDLLSFSRMGRNAMSIQQVKLGDLTRDVIMELEPDTTGRNIHWQIADLPEVTGDRSMLRMVLVNLISNALKFTQPREEAKIEIGCLPDTEAEYVIFVRDNGVGFDMAYADRLFNVFQRLHKADEFEGTGIGLANVRRIISRHGGRTWAKGEINQGATFFFSLPRSIQGR